MWLNITLIRTSRSSGDASGSMYRIAAPFQPVGSTNRKAGSRPILRLISGTWSPNSPGSATTSMPSRCSSRYAGSASNDFGFFSTKMAPSSTCRPFSSHVAAASRSVSNPIDTDVSRSSAPDALHGPAKQSTYQSVVRPNLALDPRLCAHPSMYSERTRCFRSVCSRPSYSGGIVTLPPSRLATTAHSKLYVRSGKEFR
jgi:hypothetical protein